MSPPVDTATTVDGVIPARTPPPLAATTTTMQPVRDVGILAMELYVPSTYVRQADLEQADQVSTGKYTIGLGQTNMAFCGDNEDINSMALTAVRSLMVKYNLSYNDIGRLEVGTETILDKSKSVKSVLMQLFESSGNTDVEGIQSTNACYGGTAALLNTVAWVESSAWDGRYGLVVAGDIAVYGTVAARPTGGAGVVAMLIGPNAPLALEAGLRASHMEHAYDFYKPDFSCEYPTVDGKLSNSCYLRSVDNCYTRFCKKVHAKENIDFNLHKADYVVCHTPYVKLVQKSVSRMMYMDFVRNPDRPEFQDPNIQAFRSMDPSDTYANADLEKAFRKLADPIFTAKTLPSTIIPTNVGNAYCASLYSALISLLSNAAPTELLNKRIMMFSYGSGLAATMFSIRVRAPIDDIVRKINAMERLNKRTAVPVEEYTKTMKLREAAFNRHSYKPIATPDHLEIGTFYLTEVSPQYHRAYQVKLAN